MREVDIEKKVVGYAKKKGLLVFKFSSPASRGVPDRLFIKQGKMFFIEFKAPGKKLTKLQEIVVNLIVKQDIKVFVVDSINDGVNIVNKFII